MTLGIETFIIPQGFGGLMLDAMNKMFKLTKKQARTKIYNHLSVARKTKRLALRVSCLFREN